MTDLLNKANKITKSFVLYDGDCGICSWFVIQMQKIDKKKNLHL